MDESFLFIIAAIIFLAPFPLCIYLIVKTNKLSSRLELLERLKPLGKGKPEDAAPTKVSPTSEAITEKKEPIPVLVKTTPPAEESTKEPAPTFREALAASKSKPKPEKEQVTLSAPSQVERIFDSLRSIGLWPPKNLENREAGLIQWLAPRLGGILAVLTVIFGSVYISTGSPPWVRLVGIVAIDFSVLGLAAYLWKSQKRFATVIAGTGFAMLYLTSIAAYAAPPVRVILSPILGIGLQFLITALIFCVSLWIRERGIALIAIIFGFASSIFAAIEGLPEATLISSILLFAVTLISNQHFKWPTLVSFASVGTYLPGFSLIVLSIFETEHLIRPNTNLFLIYLAFSVSLLPFAALFQRYRKLDISKGHLRFQHSANTSLALLCGYAYFKFLQIDLLQFYGPASIVFIFWSIFLSRRGLKDIRFQLFLIKGSALSALWCVNYFSGDIRWFALALQSLVIATIAGISKSNWQRLASIGLWLTAMVIARESIYYDQTVPWSLNWALLLSLVPISIISLSLMYAKGQKLPTVEGVVFKIICCANALFALLFIRSSDVFNDSVALYIITYGIVIASLSFIKRISLIAVAVPVAVLCIAANINFWNYPDSITTAIVTVFATFAIALIASKQISITLKTSHRFVEFVFNSLWIVSIFAFSYNRIQETNWLPVFAPIFSIAILILSKKRFRNLADASIIPIVFMIPISLVGSVNTSLNLVGIILSFIYLSYPYLRHGSYYAFGITRVFPKSRYLSHLTITSWIIIDSMQSEWLHSSLLLSASLPIFYVFWRLHRHRIALVSFFGLLAAYLTKHLTTWSTDSSTIFENLPWGSEYLTSGLTTTIICLALGIAIFKQPHRRLPESGRTKWTYFLATSAFLISCLTYSYHSLDVSTYFTPIMACVSLLLIGLGIGLSIKPFRLVGIVGLLVPITRLFIYDIKETLFRIIAFAALSLLLGLIGYLYSRFQSKIK